VSRYWSMMLLLAALWGASYLFIKVAVEDLQPAPLMAVRTLGAAALLLAYLVWRIGRKRALAELKGAWRHCLVLGALNAAVPWWLIAWGEQHIDSGLAAVLQASVPIFNALILLKVVPHERLTATRAGGLAVGLTGVAVVTGIHPDRGAWAIVGALAVVLSSISYASGGVYGQLAITATRGPVLAAGSVLFGGLMLLPLALFQLPSQAPGWQAVGSLLALTVLGTALAQLILFRMLALHGSARLSLVTYLMPPFALVYGALLLDEKITWWTLGGLGLILGGVALASGTIGLQRRSAVPARP
jgi:drug/metabolite transporter (DMT)-like permease